MQLQEAANSGRVRCFFLVAVTTAREARLLRFGPWKPVSCVYIMVAGQHKTGEKLGESLEDNARLTISDAYFVYLYIGAKTKVCK